MSVKHREIAVASWIAVTAVAALAAIPALARGQAGSGVIDERDLSLDVAQQAASAAIARCHRDVFPVAVTVVDRAGQVKVTLRDDHASPHTTETSRRKAYATLTLQTSTSILADVVAANPTLAGLKDIPDVILLGGGLPVVSGNAVIGGIGVAGASSPDQDEACAQAGLSQIADQLRGH